MIVKIGFVFKIKHYLFYFLITRIWINLIVKIIFVFKIKHYYSFIF